MPKTIVITQSNYIPWRGYFDLIRWADLFVLYDSVQFTKRDWRNRNLIKTARGPLWLTIPVVQTGLYDQAIAEAKIADHGWSTQHWRSIVHNYARAPAFRYGVNALEKVYDAASKLERLSDINALFLSEICKLLGIVTPLVSSRSFSAEGDRNERLVAICRAAGARTYISGPAARAYLDEKLFEAAGIDVQYADYSGLPAYPQLFGPFEPRMSILDLVFNTGARAPDYLSPAPCTTR